jgi:hypothetical protein
MRETKWRGLLTALAMVVLATALVVPATALAEGGKTIATAPSVVYGQPEFGNTAMGAEYPGKGCGFLGFNTYRDQFWLLNVTAGDLLSINWGGVNNTELRLYPVGTTDYTVFGESTRTAAEEDLNGNNKSQLQYNVPASGVMPLEFSVCYDPDNETPGPYDFAVTAQHGLSVNLLPRPHVRTNSVIYGSAALVSGTPVPDGMSFTLTASWGNGSASYSATSAGGSLVFTLALPEEVEGQTITLSLSRPADSTYQAPKAVEIQTLVAKPRVQPPPVKPHHRHHRHRHPRRHHHHHRHHWR